MISLQIQAKCITMICSSSLPLQHVSMTNTHSISLIRYATHALLESIDQFHPNPFQAPPDMHHGFPWHSLGVTLIGFTRTECTGVMVPFIQCGTLHSGLMQVAVGMHISSIQDSFSTMAVHPLTALPVLAVVAGFISLAVILI